MRVMKSVGYETHELCSLVSDKNSNSDMARCWFYNIGYNGKD